MQKELKDLLPVYQCHKIVHGFKIRKIDFLATGDAVLRPEEAAIEHLNVLVTKQYLEKHKPQAGGYYVLYDDGYESWSPAKAFEAGYALVGLGGQEVDDK